MHYFMFHIFLLIVFRNPKNPLKVSHGYDDKYFLAESLTTAAIAAQLNALQVLGLHNLSKIKQWASDRTVTLRFNMTKKYLLFIIP